MFSLKVDDLMLSCSDKSLVGEVHLVSGENGEIDSEVRQNRFPGKRKIRMIKGMNRGISVRFSLGREMINYFGRYVG